MRAKTEKLARNSLVLPVSYGCNHFRQRCGDSFRVLVPRMAEEASINLVARWRDGDQLAADQLFRRYAEQLIALARTRLSAKVSKRVDAEDVVQSAYRSFFHGSRAGRYDIRRGGDLWQLLVVITLHKLQHQVRRNLAGKRSVNREQPFAGENRLLGIQPQRLAQAPSPVEALALAEELEQLMRRLDPLHRRMLELRLQGYTVDEIATDTQRCPGTIRRVLDRIKQQLHDNND
jgi:RNA polymerase sigma factor (sigma-70 family)